MNVRKRKQQGCAGKVGRPTLYRPNGHPPAAYELTSKGGTLSDLAQAFGVAVATIETWQHKHPDFLVSIQQGRNAASDRVERALFERAIGYTFDSERIVVVSDGQGSGSHVERVPVKEHVPPDIAAIKYFLNNRRPRDWKDRSTVDVQPGEGWAKILEEADARAGNPR